MQDSLWVLKSSLTMDHFGVGPVLSLSAALVPHLAALYKFFLPIVVILGWLLWSVKILWMPYLLHTDMLILLTFSPVICVVMMTRCPFLQFQYIFFLLYLTYTIILSILATESIPVCTNRSIEVFLACVHRPEHPWWLLNSLLLNRFYLWLNTLSLAAFSHLCTRLTEVSFQIYFVSLSYDSFSHQCVLFSKHSLVFFAFGLLFSWAEKTSKITKLYVKQKYLSYLFFINCFSLNTDIISKFWFQYFVVWVCYSLF